MSRRQRLLTAWVVLLFTAASLLLYATSASASTEPTVRVETIPQWTSGSLAIYLFGFPENNATYTSDTVTIRVAVWGSTADNPVNILLDGETAAVIDHEGLFTYEWSLLGSHQLLIRCRYKIFQQAVFNVKSPPPPPPMMLVSEFNEKLRYQFTTMTAAMICATALGVPYGIWLKKKTKVTTGWALLFPAATMGLGMRYLPTLYMLIPLGLSACLVYWMAREYADYLGVSVMDEGRVDTDVLALDDEGRAIKGVGPRFWRTWFMHTKRIELLDNRHPVDFRFRGTRLRCVTVNGPGDYVEKDDRITVKCSPTLAQALTETRVIENLEDQLADTRFKLLFMERALRSVVSRTIEEIERTIEDQMLDEVVTIPEARKRVMEATERMKRSLDAEAAEAITVEEARGAEEAGA